MTRTITPTDTMKRSTRIPALDHLRVALVILVVVHHVALVYGASSPFYYVEPPFEDPAAFKWLLVFVLFNQAWFMGALFMLAGYFTPGSLDRKGPGRFLGERMIRLGIPLIVYAFVLNPIAELGVYLMPAELTGITGGPTWATYPDMIGMGPMWFVAMLLIFSFGYVAWNRMAHRRRHADAAGSRPTFSGVTAFVVGLALAGFLMRLVIPLGESFLQFPTLAYLPQYLSFFAVGAVAYRRHWLDRLNRSMAWTGAGIAAIASVILFPLAFSGRLFSLEISEALDNAMGGAHWQAAVYASWDALLSVGLTLALIAAFRAVLDHQSRFGSFLSEHGYAVYVLHIPVVVYGAYLMRHLEMPVIPKVAVVSAVVTTACFALAYGIRRIPGVKGIL